MLEIQPDFKLSKYDPSCLQISTEWNGPSQPEYLEYQLKIGSNEIRTFNGLSFEPKNGQIPVVTMPEYCQNSTGILQLKVIVLPQATSVLNSIDVAIAINDSYKE